MVKQNNVQKVYVHKKEGVNMCIEKIIMNIIPLSSAVGNLSFPTVLHGHTNPFFSKFVLASTHLLQMVSENIFDKTYSAASHVQ